MMGSLARPSAGVSSVTELTVIDGATFDTTTLVVDDDNNRIGINTATPTAALEIDGDVQLTPTAISTAHVKTTGSLDVRCTGNLKLGTDLADSVRLGRTNTTGAKIHLRSGADTDLVVTNSKVGIGTETPYTDLTIEGTITLKEQAAADGDTAAYGQLWVKTASPNQLYFTTDAGDDIQITSGTSMASSGASALNDLSDASFSSGDLTITALDTLTTSASAHDAAGTAVKILAGATTAGSTNNIAGGALTLGGGQGKGSGAGGDIIFQTANAGGSGSSLNAYATALTISDDLSSTFAGGITSTGGVNTLGATEITQGADGGAILFTLDNDDTDKIAFKIEAANIDASAIAITADALTTAHVMEVTADALTTGSIFKLVSDSSSAATRTLVEIINDNSAATDTVVMKLQNDAITPAASLIVETSANDPGSLVDLVNTYNAADRPPVFKFTKINGAQDDYGIGNIVFAGENDAGSPESIDYIKMLATASDVSDSTEDGRLRIQGMSAGSNTTFLDCNGKGKTVAVCGAADNARGSFQIVRSWGIQMYAHTQSGNGSTLDLTTDYATHGFCYLVTTDGADVTVNLPAASGAGGRMYMFIHNDSTNELKVDGYSSEVIYGVGISDQTRVTSTDKGNIWVLCDGGAWHIITSTGTWA